MNYNNTIVKKPWGHEYLLYQNEHVGIWYLYLNYGAKTSLHSHPNKKTGLVVLSGAAKVSFMNGSHLLSAGDKIMIRNGVFHSTEAISEKGIQLLEIENPNDKTDIIRLEDCYGRAGEPYEGPEHYFAGDRIVLSDVTKIGDCVLSKRYLTKKDQLTESKIMILDGMIFYKTFGVCGPGDMLDNVAFARLANKFEITPMTVLEIKLERRVVEDI